MGKQLKIGSFFCLNWRHSFASLFSFCSLPFLADYLHVLVRCVSFNPTSKEWINLDLVTKIGFICPRVPRVLYSDSGSPEQEPVTDASQIKEIAEILGIIPPSS